MCYGDDFDGVALNERIKLISARRSYPAFDNHCGFQKSPRRHAAYICIANGLRKASGLRFAKQDGAYRRRIDDHFGSPNSPP